MTYACLLIDRCTIRRFTTGVPDDYGKPKQTWDEIDDQPCRLVNISGREVVVGAEVVIADYKLFLDNVDVTEQDRIIVDDITYEILSVLLRSDGHGSHHKELLMRTVR